MNCVVMLIVAMLSFQAQSSPKVEIVNPTVERQVNPQGLGTSQPRFSWQYTSNEQQVVQQSYRIIVSSSQQNAQKGIGDLWDSKEVRSANMLYIPYQGKALESRDKCYWRVISTVAYGSKQKKLSLKSEVQSFCISLLHSSDWQAKWIGGDFSDDVLEGHTRLAARYMRKVFTLKDEIKEAKLYISGVGQYSAYLNGVELAPEEIFKPALSDYRKRVYFNTYNVSDMLQKGNNAVGVILEGGRFTAMRIDVKNPRRDGPNNVLHFGTPRMIMQLEIVYADGSRELVVSDETWKMTNGGAIRTANEFDGETYNATMELPNWNTINYDDKTWLSAKLVEAPKGVLTAQSNPNLKVQDIVKPIALFKKGDVWILDMGQNMVGCLDIHVHGQKTGDTIKLRFAETLTKDSMLYTENLRTAEVTDRYIMNGSSGQWHPMFVYHGFRFVEISGLRSTPSLNDYVGLVCYDAMPTTGVFESSDSIINAVYRNAYWGIRGNYRSMPTDCPQRDERQGWNGDRTTGSYGESYIFGNYHLYAKWLTDFEDSQLESGSLPDVVPPYWRFYFNSMTWPGAFITVADMIYTRFGDMEPIKVHYEAMKKWLSFMKTKYMVNGIMTKDTYGDWCMPPESLELIHSKDTTRITAAPVVSTPFYCHLMGLMEKFAKMLDKQEDVNFFRNEINLSTKAFNQQYFDEKTGAYANNTVTANMLPLFFKMVPEGMEDKVFGNIVSKTEKDCQGHVSTGVVGIQQLMRTLTEYGRADLALKIATNETYPSWGYMVKNGATTIWELWNGNTANPAMNSGNHVMLLGDLILWEYEYLAGIRPAEAGYQKIILKPYPIQGLDSIKATYESVSGRIESAWTCKNNHFQWDILIPANTTAEVYLPTKSGYEVKTFGSGTYHLTADW